MVPNTLSTMLFEAWRVNVVFYFQKSLAPSLPEDLAISFYIQSHKLIFAVYQLSNVHGTMKFDSHQAECSIPWLNEVLVLFTVALQLCQQLKDKVMLYTTFFDPAVGPPFSVPQFESFPDLTYSLIIPSAGVYWSRITPHQVNWCVNIQNMIVVPWKRIQPSQLLQRKYTAQGYKLDPC